MNSRLEEAEASLVDGYVRLMRCALLTLVAGLASGSQCAVASQDLSDDPADLIARAVALEHGEGITKDEQQALDLYCRAARAGSAEAQFSLGWMYANGRGILRDDAMAALLFDLAARQGHQHAEKIRIYFGQQADVLPDCMKPASVVRDVADSVETPFQVPRLVPKKIADLVNRLAPEYQIHPSLALAVIQAESNFDPNARSPKNAQGLMQLVPDTARRFKVNKPYDPEQNIRGGLAYLRWLLAYFKGKVSLVAAGYNAGEGTVDKYRGVPPYPETRDYVQRILAIYRSDTHPFDPRIVSPSLGVLTTHPVR